MHLFTFFLLLFAPMLQDGRIRPLEEQETVFDKPTLPLKFNPGKWVPLEALEREAGNFTLFADEEFYALKKAYAAKEVKQIFQVLKKAYQALENRTFTLSNQEEIAFPSLFKLELESAYLQFPWLLAILLLTGLAFVVPRFAPLFTIAAFALHSVLLGMRVAILGRPAVASMYETILFVPWVAVALCLILFYIYRQNLLLLGGNFVNLSLLMLLLLTDNSSHLETVQPVLNSQFWLSIHVLMVVASYGVFAIGSVLGHAHLIRPSPPLGTILLNVLYAGVILLTAGTFLGGVWAAQSWGRFWDWDPKESWAFIAISFYLIAIHLFRYGKIQTTGLAVGSVLGFLAVTFCWYGVNYIIGTGLHSYGFGSGGLFYYFSFIALDLLFLLFTLTTIEKRKIVSSRIKKA